MVLLRAGGGEPSTATVLFTDLVGSTEARAHLGEDAADELRRIDDHLVVQAVQRHRGSVIKSLGDGMMATFAAASDALAAAVASQQALARHNRQAADSRRLLLRVGIAVGDVAFEHGDCFGTPVIEAARLCAVAGAGQILASELVRALAGGRGGFRFTTLGAVDLKGLPAPVPAVEVRWELEDPAVPLPGALDQPGPFRFVGRERELAELLRSAKEAVAGARRVAFVGGEPGIGKTRLAGELGRTLHEQGAAVLYGRCQEELGNPYQPFADALRTYAAACPSEDLAVQVGPLGPELVRLVPALAQQIGGLGEPVRAAPETERYRLFEAVVGFLAGVAAFTPVLLVLDDLHWADHSTIALLCHLVSSSEPTRLLVLGTYRDTDLHRGHPLADLLADLRREQGVRRLTLSGLDEADVAQLVVAAAVGTLDVVALSLGRTVWAETDGNAFFVGAVLQHLAESWGMAGPAGSAADIALADLGVPAGVREVIGRRLSRLPTGTSEVLEVAAVIGREFDIGVVLEASGVGPDDVLAGLERAEEARLIAPVQDRIDRYGFAHALVRSTIYDDLPASRRARLHLRVANALEHRATQPEAAELAHHFHAAGPAGDPDRAVRYAVAAAEAATAALAHEQAARLYELALEATGWAGPATGKTRGAVLLARGQSWLRAGRASRARTAFLAGADEAQRRDDPLLLARAAVGVGETSAVWGVDDELVVLLEAALTALGDRDSPLAARLLARLAQAFYYTDRARCLEFSARAVSEAREGGDQSALGAALRARHVALSGPDDPPGRLAVANEIVRVAEAAGEPELALQGRAWHVVDSLELGDLEAVDREMAEHAELALALRQPLHLRDAAMWRAMRTALTGRFAEAEAAIEEAYALGRRGDDPSATVMRSAQQGVLAYLRGRPDELAPFVDEWRQLGRDYPTALAWRGGVAFLATGLGQRDLATSEFGAVATQGFDSLPRDVIWLPLLAFLAETCAWLGDCKQASTLYSLLRPYAGRVVVGDRAWGCLGATCYFLGRLAATMGRRDDAEVHFESALALNRHLGAEPWVARTQYEYARVLLELGGDAHTQTADDLACRTEREAEALGMSQLASQAHALCMRVASRRR